MGAYEAAEIAFRGTHVIPATPEGAPVSETAPVLCAAPCPRGHDHTCARSPKHCGFHRDVKQKGDESCSWTDDDRPAVGPVYESPEELAAEVVRLREESVRAYSQGVEDMRQAAVNDLLKRDSVEWALGGEYGGIDAARIVRNAQVSAQTPSPAPRDTELIQQVRALVKRYGAPAIAAEAARQAKHH